MVYCEHLMIVIRVNVDEDGFMMDVNQLPERFLEEMRVILGDEFQKYRESFQEGWNPGLRVNTLKVQPEELLGMVPWRLERVAWTEKGFYYDVGIEPKPSKHPFYYAGLYYLQEPSAMTPAAMLPVTPGDRVLDLCAAPGGKSTELAARLKGRGLLVSNDISYSRARALLKNLELAGAANICVTSEEPERLARVWPGFFDKILVDAPCSGEGMFRREESMVKDWLIHGPEFYGPLQRQIMESAVDMLKPGGLLLFSTCTFSRREDEETILYILDRFPQMELVPLDLEAAPGACGGVGLSGCMRLFPHRLKGEGHFLALLRKRNEGVVSGDDGEKRWNGGEAHGCFGGKKGIGDVIHEEEGLKTFFADVKLDLDKRRIVSYQGNVYYLPQGLDWNLPLRFLRTGLLLGELKKGRFEPSQALAMALRADQYSNVLRLRAEDERVIRYLKGETLGLIGKETPVKGWCLVTIGEFPLGWAKGSGMNLKNKYYPGWRWH